MVMFNLMIKKGNKLNSTINGNSGSYTLLTHEKTIKKSIQKE